jgi:hypothetical protein
MRSAQHLLPSVAPGVDFLHFKDTFGARRVESALSKACLAPDVSNRRGQGTFGGWPDGSFPQSAPMTKPKQGPTPFSQRRPSFLLSMRCCVDPLSRHAKRAEFGSRGGRGAHARIRTGDLFLTKWSSIPGEFEPILAPTVDFGGDHLLRFKTKGAPGLTRCSRTFGATVQYQD